MNLADRLARSLAGKLGYDDEQRQVMAYGLGAAIQMLELLAISLIFGLVFRCVWECMLLFMGVGLLRRTAGGAHCATYMACILTSSLSICLLALVCRYAVPVDLNKRWYALLLILPAFACAYGFAWKRVPVAAPNKPIAKPEKRARLRRQCFGTLTIYLALSILLLAIDWPGRRNISALSALVAAVWWQCFTLTAWSGHLARAMDKLFSGT